MAALRTAVSKRNKGTQMDSLVEIIKAERRHSANAIYRSIPLWRRSVETLSFARPLRRRALSTFLPFEEAMRFLKPCLLRRLRTEG